MTFINKQAGYSNYARTENGLITESGTSVKTVSSNTFDTSVDINNDGDGYLYKALLSCRSTANAKGVKLQVGGVDIIELPATTTLNNDDLVISLMVFRKSATVVKYIAEIWRKQANPIIKCSGDLTYADYIGTAILFDIITDTTVIADLTLEAVSLTKLTREQ
tara:strand:- start:95 stop:583 length:489 start_codon:yes stop_codon:yes gene_type:complete